MKFKKKEMHNNGIDLFKEVEYQIILLPPCLLVDLLA
jgi:hypothetical protein